ncbi:MAG: hypothetical protein LBQ40_06650 [Clostridiales bacterium]|jgi:D-alanine-D-alanine ligase|nr:hypothetical protein [Clostridiales bacterium]
MKKNVLVIFGGRSCEHDISVITAVQAAGQIDGGKYNVLPLYIKGEIYTGNALLDIDTYKNFEENKRRLKKAEFKDGGVRIHKNRFFKTNAGVYCALMCCHGGLGENGGLQGLLEFYNIPYTSPGIAPSAIFMDKELTKRFAAACKLPTLPYFIINDANLDGDIKIPKGFDFPLIVKPASLGSSIGIAVAHDRAELAEACAVAAEFDAKIIVERALTDFLEINCAAVKNGSSIMVSECEAPLSWREFLTFEEKYCGSKGQKGGKNSSCNKLAHDGMKGLNRQYPADIPHNVRQAVQNITRTVYSSAEMRGSVRMDFLIDKADDKIYLNEVNTIPGSLGFYLFENNGVSFSRLTDIMIETAVADAKKKDAKKYAYLSNVL